MDRKTIGTQLECLVDIGSAQIDNSLKYSMVNHQTAAKTEVPNKTNNYAISDNPNVRTCFVDIDGVKYSRDGVSIDCASKDNLDHCRDPKLFYEEYVGEQTFLPFMKENT